MPAMGEPTKYTDAEALAAAKAGAGVTEGDLVQVASGDKLPVIDGSNLTGLVSTFAALTDVHVVRKSADQTVNDSTTLVDDDELTIPVGANEVWEFHAFILVHSGTTPDIKVAWTIPSGGAFAVTYSDRVGATSAMNASVVDTHSARALQTSGSDQSIQVWGVYIGSSTAGNVQLQWAQNALEATDTKVLANSYIIAHRLA